MKRTLLAILSALAMFAPAAAAPSLIHFQISPDHKALTLTDSAGTRTYKAPNSPAEGFFATSNGRGISERYLLTNGSPGVPDFSGIQVADSQLGTQAMTYSNCSAGYCLDVNVVSGTLTATLTLPYNGTGGETRTAASFIGMAGKNGVGTIDPVLVAPVGTSITSTTPGSLVVQGSNAGIPIPVQYGNLSLPAVGTSAPFTATVCTNLKATPTFVFDISIVSGNQQPANSTLQLFDENAANCAANDAIINTGQLGAGAQFPVNWYFANGVTAQWTSTGVIGGARLSIR